MKNISKEELVSQTVELLNKDYVGLDDKNNLRNNIMSFIIQELNLIKDITYKELWQIKDAKNIIEDLLTEIFIRDEISNFADVANWSFKEPFKL